MAIYFCIKARSLQIKAPWDDRKVKPKTREFKWEPEHKVEEVDGQTGCPKVKTENFRHKTQYRPSFGYK